MTTKFYALIYHTEKGQIAGWNVNSVAEVTETINKLYSNTENIYFKLITKGVKLK